jgi:hypothetical protein
MFRYRTKAERTYGRRLQAAEYVRKLHLQAQQRVYWENLQDEKLALAKQRLKLSTERVKDSNVKDSKEKEKEKPAAPIQWHKKFVPLYQTIEIRPLDGAISILRYPEIDDMLARADRAHPATEVVRCFEFPDGIPAEYAWVQGPDVSNSGIVWEQSFVTIAAWRAHEEKEAIESPGHYLPRNREPGADET